MKKAEALPAGSLLPLRRADHPSLRAAICEALRRDIVLGLLPPGRSVNIKDAQDRFGVSSSAVREALCQLAADGLIAAEEQRGFRVAPVSLADLQDLTRMRIEIECFAIRDAIVHGDEQWEVQILTAFHKVIQIPTNKPVESPSDIERLLRYKDAHKYFHDALVSACTSNWAKRFRSMLHEHSERYSAICRACSPVERFMEKEHRSIMSAVLARKPDEACDLISEHVNQTARILTSLGIAI